MSDGILTPARPPVEPTRLSPSRASVLLECGLRYAWEAAKEPPRLPLPPAVRLGIVVHEMYSRAGRGQLVPEQGALRAVWSELVEQAEARMAVSWLERHSVPLRRSLRNYEERRLAAFDFASILARQVAARSGTYSRTRVGPESYLVLNQAKTAWVFLGNNTKT